MRKYCFTAGRLCLAIAYCLLAYVAGSTGASAQQGQWRIQDRLWFEGEFEGGATYLKIVAVDTNHLMAIGTVTNVMSIIRQTTDGGRSWRTARADTGGIRGRINVRQIADIAHPSASLAIAVGDSNMVLRTTDGGDTWTEWNVPGRHARLRAIAMADPSFGAFIKSPDSLFVTSDGGATWSGIPAPQDDGDRIFANTIAAISPTTLVIGASNQGRRLIFRSDDAGATWTSAAVPVAPTVLEFLDPLNGWSVGMPKNGDNGVSDHIERTTDGGSTWHVLLHDSIGAGVGIDAADVVDEDFAIGVSPPGKIIWTTDGGDTWTVNQEMLGMQNLGARSIAAPSRTKMWIGTVFLGEIWHWDGAASSAGDDVRAKQEPGLAAVPTPASTSVVIAVPTDATRGATFKVFDEIGRMRESRIIETGSHQLVVDVSGWPDGVYFITVPTARGLRGGTVTVVR